MILVVGATGNLGGAITRMLLAQGQPVRILVRPQSNYQALADLGVQVVPGDLKERSSLNAACEGVDIVISTASGGQRGGEDTVETVDWEGHRNLIDAAKTAGVKQFIFVSVAFADPQSPVPIFQAKGRTEDYLRESGLPYTIIAPNMFMDYERVLGRPIPLRSVAPGEPVPGLPEEMAALLAGLDTFDSPLEMTSMARTLGVQLTPLEEVVRRTVRNATSV